jgi:hypothetical protein
MASFGALFTWFVQDLRRDGRAKPIRRHYLVSVLRMKNLSSRRFSCSDAAAALVGSLGLVPSINAGDDFIIGEPCVPFCFPRKSCLNFVQRPRLCTGHRRQEHCEPAGLNPVCSHDVAGPRLYPGRLAP